MEKPTALITLEGREIGLMRQALVVHPPTDVRLTNKLLGQLENGPAGRDEADQITLKVNKAACDSLSRSVAALKVEPNYSPDDLQYPLGDLIARFDAVSASLRNGREDGDVALAREERDAEFADAYVYGTAFNMAAGANEPASYSFTIDEGPTLTGLPAEEAVKVWAAENDYTFASDEPNLFIIAEDGDSIAAGKSYKAIAEALADRATSAMSRDPQVTPLEPALKAALHEAQLFGVQETVAAARDDWRGNQRGERVARVLEDAIAQHGLTPARDPQVEAFRELTGKHAAECSQHEQDGEAMKARQLREIAGFSPPRDPGQAPVTSNQATGGEGQASSSPKSRLDARLSQGPTEPRFSGMERPFQLEMAEVRRTAGRGM